MRQGPGPPSCRDTQDVDGVEVLLRPLPRLPPRLPVPRLAGLPVARPGVTVCTALARAPACGSVLYTTVTQ